MKHNLNCDIIKDLLPGYVEDLSSTATKNAVEEHLENCESCRKVRDNMMFENKDLSTSVDKVKSNEDKQLFKKVKRKLNKKLKISIACSAMAVVVIAAAFHVLFNVPIKNVDLSDISVTADVYSLAELIENPADGVPNSESVAIFFDEVDNSETIEAKIPELGKITLTEDTIEKCKYATVISVNSEYFLRTIKRETKDDTIYISAFKTTLLNNKAESYQKIMNTLEFREINRIVFVDDNGKETVLWENKAK